MGSNVSPNPAGWELGVYDVDLTPCGEDWLGRVLGKEKGEVPLVVEGEAVKRIDAEEVVRKEEKLLVSVPKGICWVRLMSDSQSIQQVVSMPFPLAIP